MHITSSTEDFREIADLLRFRFEDLIPVKEQNGWWRVPPELLSQKPAFASLIRLYNQEKFPDAVQRARSRSLRISYKNGPDLLLIESHLSTGPNNLFVGIILPKPLKPRTGASRALLNAEEPDTETSNREVPSNSPPNSATSVASENQKDIDDPARNLNSVPHRPLELPPSDSMILRALEEQLEFVIKSVADGHHSIQSSALGVGDILELGGSEVLQVKSGVLSVLGIGYGVEEFVDGS